MNGPLPKYVMSRALIASFAITILSCSPHDFTYSKSLFPEFLDQSELIGLIRIQNWKFVKLCGEYLAHIHLEIIFQR